MLNSLMSEPMKKKRITKNIDFIVKVEEVEDGEKFDIKDKYGYEYKIINSDNSDYGSWMTKPISLADLIKLAPKGVPLEEVFLDAETMNSEAVWEGPVLESLHLYYDKEVVKEEKE